MGFSRTICIAVETVLTVLLIIWLVFFFGALRSWFVSPIVYITIGIVAAYIPISTILLINIRGNIEYRYLANAREFSFFRRDKKGAVAHFFYKDVLSVDYAPHKFILKDNGYFVTIETKSGFFTYKYVFPRYKHTIKQKDLPFEIIRERISPSVKLPEQQGVRISLTKKEFWIEFAKSAFCVLAAVTAIILRNTCNDAQDVFVVITVLLALMGMAFSLWKIVRGAEYRFRSDENEFMLRRADGIGKTIRANFDEIEEIRVRKGIFTALFKIKLKTKTLRLRYISSKKTRLEETPFGVFLKKK